MTTILLLMQDKNGEHAAVPVPVDEHYLTTAMILTLSVCYHARLQERADYEELVSASFTSPLNLSGGAQQFRNEIKWYSVQHIKFYVL